MVLDTIAQAGMLLLSPLAIILIAKKNKWGFVIGLLSQPFFFITSYINGQWGLFLVAIVFTFSWILGIYEWFLKNKKVK